MSRARVAAALLALVLAVVVPGQAVATPMPTPNAGAPAVTLSPASLAFGSQDVGTRGAAQTVHIVNSGTAPLFINGFGQGGNAPADFTRVDDQCSGVTVAAGGSCTIAVAFNPTATGTRTAAMFVQDNAANSPQTLTLSGTGTSSTGATPFTVDTTGMPCTGGVCDLGGSPIVNDFFFAGFSASGDATPPFRWAVAGGALPTGLFMHANGQLWGTPTVIGSSTFTIRATDATGQTATQAFRITVGPRPAPGNPACQHAPNQNAVQLSGPAIGGRSPSGRAVADQSKLTACGGFVTITAQVDHVNLPDGTPLWITLSGLPIGRVILANGSATMRPYVYPSNVRKLGIQVFPDPFPPAFAQQPILAGAFT